MKLIMPVKCLLGGCGRQQAPNMPAGVQAQGPWDIAKVSPNMDESLGSVFSRADKNQRQLGWRPLPEVSRKCSQPRGRVVCQVIASFQPIYLKVEAPGSKVLLTPKYLIWCYIFNKLLGDAKQFCSCVIQQEEFSRLLWTQQFQVLWCGVGGL